ncbi:MAG: YbaN family protein [Lentisphaeraceae bacterium]|nr:YbaN family protein [Lentisphaeraceae bacterium]
MKNKSPHSPLVQYLLNGCAFLSLLLGIIGIFVPLMPTTPFVILALWLFSKSSERFYKALMAHKICGPPVKDYLAGRGIRKKYKIISLGFMWLSLLASFMMSFAHPNALWVRIILPIIGCSVSYMILRQPTCPTPPIKEDEHSIKL